MIETTRIYTPLNAVYKCILENVVLPDYLGSKDVFIDKEIVEAMKVLWGQKISTLSCCCGHGFEAPSVVIENIYNDKEVMDIKKILYETTGDWWTVLTWKLVKI
jgi:hypothetical protein